MFVHHQFTETDEEVLSVDNYHPWFLLLLTQSSKLRARVIQLEEDLSSTRQQHRDAAQEVKGTFIVLYVTFISGHIL